MKTSKLKLLFILLFITVIGCSNETSQSEREIESEHPAYDEELASELGADEYGMRRYVMALLKIGPNRDQDEETARQLQEGHMENIRRLAAEGKLILAGPFLDDGELRGIFLFDVDTIEEAREMTETDPAIIAGRLIMELHPWYGSAGLMKVNDIHERIKTTIP